MAREWKSPSRIRCTAICAITSTAFEGLIGTSPAKVGIARDGASNMANAEIVSGNYFSVLGVPAAKGRMMTQADDTTPGGNPVAVVSFNYWKTHLGADAGVVGQTLSINGKPFQIMGVTAPEFQSAVWGQVPDVFVPMSMLEQVQARQGKSTAEPQSPVDEYCGPTEAGRDAGAGAGSAGSVVARAAGG